MNKRAFLSGYLFKEAAGTATIESFVPPTDDPSPQTDTNVNAVQDAEKEVATDKVTANHMEENI